MSAADENIIILFTIENAAIALSPNKPAYLFKIIVAAIFIAVVVLGLITG